MSQHSEQRRSDQHDQSGTSDHSLEANAGIFYWQLPEEDVARLRAKHLPLVDEGYLAHDINWGRRLLDTPADPEEVPAVAADWPGPPTDEHVADAISAILQVAVELGFDPIDVCGQALHTHRVVRRFAAAALRR